MKDLTARERDGIFPRLPCWFPYNATHIDWITLMFMFVPGTWCAGCPPSASDSLRLLLPAQSLYGRQWPALTRQPDAVREPHQASN